MEVHHIFMIVPLSLSSDLDFSFWFWLLNSFFTLISFSENKWCFCVPLILSLI